MLAVRFLLLLGLLLAPVPATARAAPPQQDSVCDLMRLLPTDVRGWLASVRALDSRTVEIDGLTLQVQICARPDQSGSAPGMLDVLAEALPRLSQHAGLPYRGDRHRSVIIVREADLPAGVNALVDREGVVQLKGDNRSWTIIHEGAHYWANDDHIAEPWMIEAYAQYLTSLVMAERRGIPERRPVAAACATQPLIWWNGDNDCPYSTGLDVFRELAEEVGTDRLREAIGRLREVGRIDSTGLLDGLEDVSGKDLTGVFRYRVFPSSADATLDLRRAARAEFAEARGMVEALGLQLPGSVEVAIRRWDFDAARRALAEIRPALSAAADLLLRCQDLGLPCAPIWQSEDLHLLGERIAQARQLLGDYTELRDDVGLAGLPLPAGLDVEVATLGPQASPLIARARDLLRQGEALEARCAGYGLTCGAEWHMAWTAGDLLAAEQAVARTGQLLERAATAERACDDLRDACRAIWVRGFKDGGKAGAGAAIDLLEGLLDESRKLDCGGVKDACTAAWREPLAQGDLQGADRAIGAVRALLGQAGQAAAECARAGWPCGEAWHEAFRAGGVERAQRQLVEQRQVLGWLSERQAALDAPHSTLSAAIDRAWGMNPQDEREQAALSFAAGDTAAARQYVARALYSREAAAWLSTWWPVGVLLAGAAVVLALLLWRRRRPSRGPRGPRPPGDALLSDLLAGPPLKS